jgi:hypothetical protein
METENAESLANSSANVNMATPVHASKMTQMLGFELKFLVNVNTNPCHYFELSREDEQ